MKKAESRSNFDGISRGILALFVFAIFCVSANITASYGTEPDFSGTDETRKIIKQSRKLTRAGLLDDAEKMLRRAIETDSRSTSAKVELAFVLSKQRRLGEAYNLVFPVAEAEPENSRAYAVLGAVLLAAGRFNDARLIFYNSLRLNRSEDLGWAGIGLVEFYENKIPQSLINIKEAVFHNANEPDYLFALAQISARAERYGEAADAYYRFLSVSKDTDKDRRERIKGLIKFLQFLGHKQALYYSSGNDSSKVKFELVGNRPIITVQVNGRNEPLRFVLDTGSGITVISDKTAKMLKVKSITRGGHAKGIGGDGRFEIVYGFLQQVDIGKVAVRNVPVYIREFHDPTQKIDGYIGLALISKFLTTIDYGSKTFTLTKKDNDAREFRENGAMSLPLRLTSSGFLSGEVQLEGINSSLNFIVDTGASVSVISDRVANEKEILPHLSEEKLRVIGAAGITEGVPSYMLPRVTFGSHSRRWIEAIALDLDLINEASGFEQSGILGGNFLKNYSLTFDFRNSKVTFTSVTPEN
ncbi:MAG: aspartyl protease family protein [Pyrinomonadaceae bacterium]|nr:aspartyl protease family protein [Acidobacteriota bacterium]MBK7933492.1 aspartyl protease family protein [Acidobacteriota bacterium]MBP7377071.1 aspartyl protease family protein [Pyrinomonadaceae bacterium]